jgi:hypothetical protein
MRICFALVASILLAALVCPSTAQRPATHEGEQASSHFITEVRLRKLHLARPDLIPYPIATEVYC